MSKENALTRLQTKLEDLLANKKYYEAHQVYRTLYFRLSGQEKYEELIELLEKGSKFFLENDQMESGADLSSLFVDILRKSETPITPEWVTKVTYLFKLMRAGMPERDAYLVSATKWAKVPHSKFSDPLFHEKIAMIYWKEENFKGARYHYLRSDDSKNFAAMLIHLQSSKGYKQEVDLFIAQAVLQALCLKKDKLASEIFVAYTKVHPEILNTTGPPYKTKLLDAIHFLLISVQDKAVEKYHDVLRCYKNSLSLDASYKAYLESIGIIYFDIKPANRQRGNGVFDNFIQSILSGLEGTESEPEEEVRVSNSRPVQDSMQDLE